MQFLPNASQKIILIFKQAYQLEQGCSDKSSILESIHDLRQTIHTVLKCQTSRQRMAEDQNCQKHLSISYSDLSCGELSNK
jgi:hypothetical protein